MVSDVPSAISQRWVGFSSIVAMMCRAMTRQTTKQPVRTYTITFPHKYRVGETTLDDPMCRPG